MKKPEPRDVQENLSVQRRIDETLSGARAIDIYTYPYFNPEYRISFLHIGTEKQLFLDNYILAHLEDVEREICRPQKYSEPLLAGSGLPWEPDGWMGAFPVVYTALEDPDDGKFKLWYRQPITGDPLLDETVICYAESDDSLHWYKPLSEKCMPFKEHRATNIVKDDAHDPGIVINHDRHDPNHKFLLYYRSLKASRERGLPYQTRLASSPDGISWTDVTEEGCIQHHHHEQRGVFWDESIGLYVSYGQHSHCYHHIPGRTRKLGRQTSPDLIHWSPKEPVLSVDDDPSLTPDMEFHEGCVQKVGGMYIATVGQCHTDPLWLREKVRKDLAGRNMRMQFYVDLALYTSRDGRQFRRAHGPEAWVENGPPGSSDHGYACYSNPALYHNGQMVIPYIAISDKQHVFDFDLSRAEWDPVPTSEFERQKELWKYRESVSGTAVKRTVAALLLREDGWAALKPKREFGKVLTKQFVFEGDTLRVNADCSYGFVKVELLDPDLKPYKGFAADDCEPLSSPTNKIWHTVRWNGSSDVSSLWNQPVRVCLHLQEASLYALQFIYQGGMPLT